MKNSGRKYPSPLVLTEDDIERYFGSAATQSGIKHQQLRQVSQDKIDLATKTVAGEVAENTSEKHSVKAVLGVGRVRILSTYCTCAVRERCKHAAALLIHILRAEKLNYVTSGTTQSSPQPSPVMKSKKLVTPQASSPTPGAASLYSKSAADDVIAKARAVLQSHLSQPPSQINSQRQVTEQKLSVELENWIKSVNSAIQEESIQANVRATQTGCIAYVLTSNNKGTLFLSLYHQVLIPSPPYSTFQEVELSTVLANKPAFAGKDDMEILNLFRPDWRSYGRYSNREFPPNSPEICRLLIEKLIASERCYWQTPRHQTPPLTLGPAKNGTLAWVNAKDGNQNLKVFSNVQGDVVVFAGNAWYVNERSGWLGALELPVSSKVLQLILDAPPLDPAEATAATTALRKVQEFIPLPKATFSTHNKAILPKPKITLTTQDARQTAACDNKYWHCSSRIIAQISFDYGPITFPPGRNEVRKIEDNQLTVYERPPYIEAKHIAELTKHGIRKMELGKTPPGLSIYGFPEGNDIDWLKFIEISLPQLAEKEWQISYDEAYKKLAVLEAQERWILEAGEEENFWLPVNLDIQVNGKKVSLLPVINQAIKHIPGKDPLVELERQNIAGKFYAALPTGGYIVLPFERVKVIVAALVELFDQDHFRKTGQAELSLPQLARLTPLLQEMTKNNAGWKVSDKLTKLMDKIKIFNAQAQVKPPKSFKAQLRDYQLEGLTWLNFLREFELGGILADDMGLGKTVQTLAHIAVEKSAKRLNKPVLVICPTSVLPNWLSEIEKFTPTLKAVALWGKERSNNFKQLAKSDIVVTTYALATRDCEVLRTQEWKAVILDEAQYIKNPTTQTFQAVRQFKSDYRLCLTGTPIENHLGELWSQFNFVMPGYLRDQTSFNANYRTPIEKQANGEKQKQLSSKIKPFLLRRTKELVAAELPEKTTMIKKVELGETQRDLYETVRLAMYQKIREILDSKGLAKSQIAILDAMLKLRQVCCDPRLVAIPSAKKVKSSAKLEQLLEMLEELLEEGKKILLFSQFTSMLDLIIPELEKRKIEFVEIRGSTTDRATPVKKFQNREAPLFLLSLKAGGTGLNLTEADTVIHYDPWWNPAVEAQATDRAHRIGQKQAVFVFKMIAAGTIEERLIQLQERKKHLAQSIYSDMDSLPSKLTAEDLEALFSPID